MLLAGLLLSLLCLNVKDMSKINTPTEIWKPVVGFEGLYEVSNYGKIKVVASDTLRNFFLNHAGYYQLTLTRSGKCIIMRVSRAVAIAFLPNPENKKEVNHKNGIKTDNRVENLEWCTPSENQKHAYKNGLKIAQRGKNNRMSIPVYQFTLDRLFIKKYDGLREAARQNNFSMGNIQQCCVGVYKQRYGFKWSYENNLKQTA